MHAEIERLEAVFGYTTPSSFLSSTPAWSEAKAITVIGSDLPNET